MPQEDKDNKQCKNEFKSPEAKYAVALYQKKIKLLYWINYYLNPSKGDH